MQAGGEVAFLYALASHLHRSVKEISELPEEELNGWAAYIENDLTKL